jgi:hypothetical protein
VDLDPEVKDLDPCEFLSSEGTSVHAKTLRHILDSRSMNTDSTSEILAAFFSKEELDLNLEKGFCQQSSIGSAVMAVFADSLLDSNSPNGRKVRFGQYLGEPTRFLICGSLFGATGSSGIVALSKLLSEVRSKNSEAKWMVGVCGLTPYFSPPSPPLSPNSNGQAAPEDQIADAVRQFEDSLFFSEMSSEEKVDSVGKILNGFFASPEEIGSKALTCLGYVNRNIRNIVDHLYLVGGERQLNLQKWSSGGANQNQPYNFTHTVAAISAMSFFNRKEQSSKGYINIPSSKSDYSAHDLRSFELPHYLIGDQAIEPEKVFFSTALAVHLIKNRIPWSKMREAGSVLKLARIYNGRDEFDVESEYRAFCEASDILRTSIWTLVDAESTDKQTGWSLGEWTNLEKVMSDDPTVVSGFGESFERERFSSESKGRVEHGETEGAFTDFDFASWCTSENEFSRANYLRAVWRGVFTNLSS